MLPPGQVPSTSCVIYRAFGDGSDRIDRTNCPTQTAEAAHTGNLLRFRGGKVQPYLVIGFIGSRCTPSPVVCILNFRSTLHVNAFRLNLSERRLEVAIGAARRMLLCSCFSCFLLLCRAGSRTHTSPTCFCSPNVTNNMYRVLSDCKAVPKETLVLNSFG